MKVWNVHQGSRHEGGCSVGIFSSKRKALEAIEKYVQLQALSDPADKYYSQHVWTKVTDKDEWEKNSEFIDILEEEIDNMALWLRQTYIRGDLVKMKVDGFKLHACNALGKWGRGIAWAFRNDYPQSYKEYQEYCAGGNSLGTAFVTSENIICLITSQGCSPPDSVEDILTHTEMALNHLYGQIPEDSVIFSNRFNSGLFDVQWTLTLVKVFQFLMENPYMNWAVCDQLTKDK